MRKVNLISYDETERDNFQKKKNNIKLPSEQ